MRRLAGELAKLHAGESTLDAFYLATASDWRRMAKSLMRRWAVPAGVEPEDVEQELRLATWKLLPKWDPTKAPLHRFITWNAMTAAKKWMHRQRAARDDSAPSHVDIPISTMRRADLPEFEASVEAEQETTSEQADSMRALLADLEFSDQVCLAALLRSGGDVEGAARLVFDDAYVRLSFRLGSETEARRMVRRATRRVAELQMQVD